MMGGVLFGSETNSFELLPIIKSFLDFLFTTDFTVSQESLIAVVVGCILTALVLILIIIYLVKADKCCCSSKSASHGTKKDCKSNDLER